MATKVAGSTARSTHGYLHRACDAAGSEAFLRLKRAEVYLKHFGGGAFLIVPVAGDTFKSFFCYAQYMNMLAFRLRPGQDLKTGIEEIMKENNIQSGFIATCVGSLHKVTMRMAGAQPDEQDIRTLNKHFEIVSLVGTVSMSGTHLHISLSDEDGKVTGGHLKEGSIVTTTAEVVIGYDKNIKFDRVIDETTGFEELSVS